MYDLLSQDSEDFGLELFLHFNTIRVGKYPFDFYICSYLELKNLGKTRRREFIFGKSETPVKKWNKTLLGFCLKCYKSYWGLSGSGRRKEVTG